MGAESPPYILISFCNTGTPGRPALAVLDAKMQGLRFVRLPTQLQNDTGIRGLAASGGYLFAVLQQGPLNLSSLLVFDRTDMTLLNQYEFRSAGDVHSLWVSGDELYAVSSGTDEVLKLTLCGAEVVSELVFWRPDLQGPRCDMHHVNAISSWKGELIVSGFGKKTGELWSSATQGFIFNVNRDTCIASGIQQPHSLLAVDQRLFFCESLTASVQVLGGQFHRRLPGYTRGLCRIGNRLFVGTCGRRKVSRSTHAPLPHDRHTHEAKCTVSRLSLDDFTVQETIDLSLYADEIYDLLPVEDIARWPMTESLSYSRPEDAWWRDVAQAEQEIGGILPKGACFVLVDENRWGTHELFAGCRRIHFLERDGAYWGLPPDDETAVREIERLRQGGADFVVVGWPAFWWLHYYVGFHTYLRSTCHAVIENQRVIIFDLRASSRPNE